MRCRVLLTTASALCLALACSEDDPPPSSRPDAGARPDSGLITCGAGQPACPGELVCVAGFCEAPTPIPDAGTTPARGKVAVDPADLNFGAFSFGVPVERSLSVRNVGAAPLNFLALEIERNPSGEFELLVSEDLPKLLQAGEIVAVRVRYTARDAQDDRDRLRVLTDDPDQPITIVPLVAEYKGVTDIAVVVDPKTLGPETIELDFGRTPIGSTARRSVYVKNVGTGNAVLEVASVRTEPNPSLLFSVETSTALPAILNRYRPEALCGPAGACTIPGTSCLDGVCVDRAGAPIDTVRVEITFAPGGVGPVEELLVVANNDADETPYLIRLRGVGIEAGLAIRPDPIDLGTVFVGFPTNTPIVLSSTGDDLLTIEAIELRGTPAGVTTVLPGALPTTLMPGGTYELAIAADPAAAGSLAGTLHLRSTDRELPERDIPITGTALLAPIAETSTGGLDFGEVHVLRGASPPSALTLRLTNRGGSPLVTTSIGFAMGSAGELSVSPTVIDPLDPGESVDLRVTYAPRVVSPHFGTLVLTSNDPLNPRIELPVRGQGVDPTVFLFKSSPPPIPASPIDFGQVYRASSAQPVTLTVQNTGTGTLRIDRIGPTAGSSPEFVIQGLPAVPHRLPPGAALELEIGYAPVAVGSDTGAIEIASSDLDLPLATVVLEGEGVDCPPNTWDVDRRPDNGCEYSCTQRSPPVEVCNGADDDCDGTPDEGFALGDACDGVGECGAGTIECDARDPSRSTCSTNPGQSDDGSAAETCNELDDDCDGTPDDGFDLDNDTANCGDCGVVCSAANGTPSCTQGRCGISACNLNFDDCNRRVGDGCETHLQTSTTSCGLCNRACDPNNGRGVCVSGACVVAGCDTGFFDCNGVVADGCEADLVGGVNTCGNCATICTAQNGVPACDNRQCEISSCTAPWRDCNTQYIDGCETNTDVSAAHCGGCNQPCAVSNGAPRCANGACEVASCTFPFANCAGGYADGCETNTQSAIDHCGGCNQPCAVDNGSARCNLGSCEVAGCSGPFADCANGYADGCETNTAVSTLHCGGCNRPCAVTNGTPACNGVTCEIASCNFPFMDCANGYADGCETNVQTSLAHCGGCNLPCTVPNGTPSCNAGVCEVENCSGNFRDCNDSDADGCEANINTDSANCGFCGNACVRDNATASCNGSGNCQIDACTGRFRDCNGFESDGCEIDVDTSLAHCGGCNQPCSILNSVETCATGVCTFVGCEPGFVDLDGLPGCEYACTVQAGTDFPEPGFVDRDCDGIDGDRDRAIYVSPFGSNANSGLFGAPVRDISVGVSRAQTNGFAQVLVAAGFYNGIVDVVNGIGIYGGYDPNNFRIRDFSNNSVIQGGFSGLNLFGIRASNINLPTTIEGLVVQLGNNNNTGGSIYGVYSANSSSALVLTRLSVTTGRGGDGSDGSAGSPGANGNNGSVGNTGCDGCSVNGSNNGAGGAGGSSSCGRPGGRGGDGSYDAPGITGQTPSSGGAGGGGGNGAVGCNSSACSNCGGQVTGSNGGPGNPGPSFGSAGTDGSGGSGAGSLSGGLWVPGSGGDGFSGTAGSGGGGGGGGGGGTDRCWVRIPNPFGADGCEIYNTACSKDRGGGGGGGGSGGCGGTRGTRGTGGGGSFGIFLFDSSPQVANNTVSAGRGGDGGDGGRGGDGGSAGTGQSGGFGPDDAADGGRGGDGRPGGRGGHGGGGAGGASYGIYRAGSSFPTLGTNTVTRAGGGSGGFSFGSSGGTGASGNIF